MDEYKELHDLILKLENKNNNANKDNIIIFNNILKHFENKEFNFEDAKSMIYATYRGDYEHINKDIIDEVAEDLEKNKKYIYCTKCGTKNLDSEVICTKCGGILTNIDIIYCPKCGEKNSSENSFCGACGTRIQKKKYKCPKCGSSKVEFIDTNIFTFMSNHLDADYLIDSNGLSWNSMFMRKLTDPQYTEVNMHLIKCKKCGRLF